jgi:hypothetical protein
MVVRSAAGAALLAAGAALLGARLAAADPPTAQPVSVRIIVAHAASAPGSVDPECEELKAQLAPITFGSLHVVQKRQFSLAMGERGALPLPTGTELRIVPLSIIRERLNLRVEVPGAVNTRLQMQRGRPVILGGPRHAGGHLIVQIVPEY